MKSQMRITSCHSSKKSYIRRYPRSVIVYYILSLPL